MPNEPADSGTCPEAPNAHRAGTDDEASGGLPAFADMVAIIVMLDKIAANAIVFIGYLPSNGLNADSALNAAQPTPKST